MQSMNADRRVPRLLCSTGAISRGPDATAESRVTTYGPRLLADGLEVMIYATWYGRLDEIAGRFRTLGHPMPVTHGEKSIGPDLVARDTAVRDTAFLRFEENCRFTSEIGADRIVLHLWGLPDGDALIDRQLEDLPRLLDIADHHAVTLAVEAIPCIVSDPLSVIRRVLEADDRARVAIETEFLAMHGQLDAVFAAEWLWASSSVVHVHIKDFDGQLLDVTGRRRYLLPGQGTIDFERWLVDLAGTGYHEAITLEAPVVDDAGHVDVDAANAVLDGLRSRIRDAWSPGS
ncbi:MAG TPA: TIM barrel protein [Thermomicrobiales bacterium]|nr:TIM barrel protein [Thermomicrobiales bacterium]